VGLEFRPHGAKAREIVASGVLGPTLSDPCRSWSASWQIKELHV
jgi:hypothetical protein